MDSAFIRVSLRSAFLRYPTDLYCIDLSPTHSPNGFCIAWDHSSKARSSESFSYSDREGHPGCEIEKKNLFLHSLGESE